MPAKPVRRNSGSVDSGAATTVPLVGTSVQSSNMSSLPDSLSLAMDRFPQGKFREARIRRNIMNLILRSSEKEMAELGKGWTGSQKSPPTRKLRTLTSTLSCAGLVTKAVVPPASVLSLPRGNLTCASKDLNRELLCIRRFSKVDRSIVAARLIRTLDPACPTHSDIALSIFLISIL